MGEERREAETVASSLDSNSDFSILNLISVTNVDFFLSLTHCVLCFSLLTCLSISQSLHLKTGIIVVLNLIGTVL